MLDKAAVLGAVAFTASYIEAKALAEDAGVELTEEAYDEAKKTEKQEEYAGYLTNFFGGKKDGGRIGYGNGANEFMSEQMMLESNPGAAESGSPITIDTTMTGLINKYNTYKKSAPGVSEETRIFLKNDLLKSLEDAGISQEEFMMRLSEDKEMRANGGRIGYGLGNLVRGSAGVFQPTSASMSAGDAPSFEGGSGMGGMLSKLINSNPQLFKNVSGQNNSSNGPMPMGLGVPPSGNYADNFNIFSKINSPSSGMGGMFSKFFSNPRTYNQYFRDKEDFIDENLNLIDDREEVAMGGRVGRRFGSPEEGEGSGLMEMLSVEVDAGGDEEEENMMMAYEPGSFKKDKFKPMEIDAINERLQTFLDMEGGGLPLPLVGTVKGIANTLKAGKAVFTGPEKTTIIRNLAGRSRGTNAYKELGKSIPEAKRIMDNPIDYLKDAAIFKELLKGIFKKDGGRIGLKDGTGSSNRVAQLMLERDYLLSKDEDVSFIDLELERDFGFK